MHTFSIWQFTDKDIDQIAEMIRFWSLGNPNAFIGIHGEIDRRKVSSNVFEYAKSYGLVAQGKDIKDWQGKRPYWCKSKSRWYIYSGNSLMPFNPLYTAPVEVIWRILSPIFKDGHTGFTSIISDSRWLDLGVWYRGTNEWNSENEAKARFDDDHRTRGELQYLPAMVDYLCLLARQGYITYQTAGTIWRVTVCEK